MPDGLRTHAGTSGFASVPHAQNVDPKRVAAKTQARSMAPPCWGTTSVPQIPESWGSAPTPERVGLRPTLSRSALPLSEVTDKPDPSQPATLDDYARARWDPMRGSAE